jgi:hypothetical protein
VEDFFHLAAVTVDGIDRLFMRVEKEVILSLSEGFGHYEVGLPRTRHLRSAQMTLAEPDEVWEENPKAQSKWVYVKEFASLPYQFSVAKALRTTKEVADRHYIKPTTVLPDVRKAVNGPLWPNSVTIGVQ